MDTFILELIKAFPGAAKFEGDPGGYGDGTALNCALGFGASAAVLKEIYDAWPGALDVANQAGQKPLDLRIISGAPLGAIELQLQTFECDFDRCVFLLKDGYRINSEFFLSWWEERKGNDWIQERVPFWDRGTMWKLQGGLTSTA